MTSSIVSVFVVFASLSIYAQAATFTCQKCATPHMERLWHMAGYPIKYERQFFMEKCTYNSQDVPTASCSSRCITWMTDVDSQQAGEQLVVRGCLDELLGWMPENLPAISTANTHYCQHGTVEALNGTGWSNQRSLVRFCKTALCNNAKNAVNTWTSLVTDCKDSDDAQKRKCHRCVGADGSNCNSGSCQGRYCFKAHYEVLGKSELMKTCSAIDPYGGGRNINQCANIDVSEGTISSRLNLQYKGTRCYCNDKEECNGVSGLIGSVFSIIVAVAVIRFQS